MGRWLHLTFKDTRGEETKGGLRVIPVCRSSVSFDCRLSGFGLDVLLNNLSSHWDVGLTFPEVSPVIQAG